MDPKQLDDLAQALMAKLPKGIQSLQSDVEKNIHVAARAALGKMNLVTREEYDAQTQVLLRSRQKLDALEKRLALLEQQISKD